MRLHAVTLIVLLALVVPLAALPASQPAAAPAVQLPPPITAVPREGCVTSQCHANVKAYPAQHGPVNVNACDACHTVKDVATHKFDLARDGAALCTFCHKMDLGGAKVVHKPLAEGDCLGCHNPHGGYDKSTLRGTSMRDTCNKCHKDVAKDRQFIHGPVAAGACTVCHAPHMSDHPKLLLSKGREMCINCHTDMGERLDKVKFRHKAVEQDCSSCHDPHASNFPMQIRMPAVELCTSCHEPIKKLATQTKHKHPPVLEGEACLRCHTAHGGDMAKLLKGQPMSICMGCHDKPIMHDGKQVVVSVAEVLDPKKSKHGPIRDGMCVGCHNVHGSDESKLLAKPYPETFYSAFKTENYELCFTCHDQQLVLLQRTDKLTNFRNGDQSLHFVHVNKQKGRTCRACHAVHASDHEMHLRDAVPFGNWELPINYKKTANGGSCAPGCHQPFNYDRVNPALLPSATQPSPVNSAPVAPAVPDKPAATPAATPVKEKK